MTREAKLEQNLPEIRLQSTEIYSFALCCSVGNLADVPDAGTSSPKLTQEESGVPKPSQARLLISELTFEVQLLSCFGVARNVKIHFRCVHRSHNVLYLTNNEFSENFVLVFFHVARQGWKGSL